MTKDRARKKAIRAYAAEHGVSYNVARRALERRDGRQQWVTPGLLEA